MTSENTYFFKYCKIYLFISQYEPYLKQLSLSHITSKGMVHWDAVSCSGALRKVFLPNEHKQHHINRSSSQRCSRDPNVWQTINIINVIYCAWVKEKCVYTTVMLFLLYNISDWHISHLCGWIAKMPGHKWGGKRSQIYSMTIVTIATKWDELAYAL